MLLNIMDNGIKYNNHQIKEITVSTTSTKKYIQITIRDNGVGMTEETKRIFLKNFTGAKLVI